MVRSLIRSVLGRETTGTTMPKLALPPKDSRDRARAMVMGLQDEICAGLEALDGEGRFEEESWDRPEGGGGRSRVMKAAFEQGGVNFSGAGSELPPILKQRPEPRAIPGLPPPRWCCIPEPYIPTVHPITIGGWPGRWFGGGADLTPYYPFLDDARHFHRTHQAACDSVHPDLHKVFKPWCDEYFFLKHRGETRGVGGIFYDYQDSSGVLYKGQDPSGPAASVSSELGPRPLGWEQLFSLGQANGRAFLPAYAPIVEKRHPMAYGDRERDFQLYRRGRYVEFNLVWDRGTIFGLQTNGRTESILMSLPPLVRWEYGYKAEPGSREALLTELFTKPQDWLGDPTLDDRCRPHQAIN